MLYSSNKSTRPIAIIETKKTDFMKLDDALNQAVSYATKLGTRFVFVYSKNIIYSYDVKNEKEFSIDNVYLNEIPKLEILNKFNLIKGSDLKLTNKIQIQSRTDLIKVFDYANKQLRSAGITIGLTRFTEFSNLLFLKLISEDNNNFSVKIPAHVKWDNYKNKEGSELLDYINDTVIPVIDRKFLNSDEESIFEKLRIKDTVALKKIIDKLSELDLSDIKTDIKGDAFEYFIQKYNDSNKDMGEYFTPRHIVDFLVKIAEPQFMEKIYDPFCGTGGILISAFNYVNEQMDKDNILDESTLEILRKNMLYGSELSATAKIAKMNMILTGDGHSNIKQQNTFENPVRGKYDLVITNIPFNQTGTSVEGIYEIETLDGNSQAIQHIVKSLKKNINSRAFIIVPEGVLNNKETRDIRKHLLDNNLLKGVISFPCGTFLPYTETKTSVLCITHNTNSKVFFSKIKNDGFTLTTRRRKVNGISDLDEFIANNPMFLDEEHPNYQYVSYDEIKKEGNYSLLAFKYEKEIPEGYIKLRDIVERSSVKNIEEHPTASVVNSDYFGLPLGETFWGQNFTSVTSEENSDYNVVLPKQFTYNPARINVGSIGINMSQSPVAVSKAYPVFKIASKQWLPEYLFLLLRYNDEVKQEIKARSYGTVRQSLSFDDLIEISIPIVTKQEQLVIVSEYMKKYEEYIKVKTILDNYSIAT